MKYLSLLLQQPRLNLVHYMSSLFIEALAAYTPVSPVVPTAPTINPSTITTGQELLETLQNVLGWAFAFALVLGVAALIAGGILYITAGGAGKAKTATTIIIYAVAGIAITGFSWTLVNVVGNILFGKTLVGGLGSCTSGGTACISTSTIGQILRCYPPGDLVLVASYCADCANRGGICASIP